MKNGDFEVYFCGEGKTLVGIWKQGIKQQRLKIEVKGPVR